jgi:DNA-binding IclR family transcriptional regulator
MENTAPKAPAYPIESVDNALRLLLMFRGQKHIRVSEAGRSIGVARSTAHRLLAMLQHHGFVLQEATSRAYVAGPALVDVGLSVVRDMDIRSQSRPSMEALAEKTGETVHLIVLQGRQVLFIDCVESTRAVRVASRTGMLLPAHCTSAGKALLAELTREQVRLLYPSSGLEGMTKRSITSRGQLERELEAVRRRGFAVNRSESEADICSVGVAIHDRLRRARAALSVAAPAVRFRDARIARFARLARDAAAQIGQFLA